MDKNQAYKLSRDFLDLEIGLFTQKQVKELQGLMQFHSEMYYEKDESVISDGQYDELLKKLQLLEVHFDMDDILGESVWSELKQSSFMKVKHSRPMISLDNTYNADELRDFDTRIKRILKTDAILPYTLEFKFDGLGIELVYNEWVLEKAITRGNWVEWEDVTENIMQIKNIPKTIGKPGIFEVRGEVVMPISSFERLNKMALEEWEKIFSNPRNAASGSLRVLDISITKKRDLKYLAYDVSDFSAYSWWKYSSMIYELEHLWFEISSYFPECQDISEVISSIESIWDIKKTIDFEIDGLVIKLNDISLWGKIWFTEHHPRYAIAYKFPAEIVTTVLESVQHSVGRTGSITPVANLEPVNIWWAIIRRATLHNYDETQKLWVRIGDSIFLKRAGEVIPKVISVASSAWWEEILPPSTCPSCWEEVLKDESKVRYYCPNSYRCPAQMREKLAFAVGKQWFNIDWFGEKQAEVFYKLGFIEKFWDIFRLKNYRDEILALEWFQEKSVNKLLEAIENVRNTDIVTFLKALWIPGVGKKTAKTLWKVISSLESEILSWNWDLEQLQALPDIGPEVALSVVDFFTQQSDIAQDLLSVLNIEFPDTSSLPETQGRFTWKKVCITGSFEWYKRDELAEILEQQGWEFMGSVSAKTDFLLAWEKAGSKLKKAQELWVEILSLEDFLREM